MATVTLKFRAEFEAVDMNDETRRAIELQYALLAERIEAMVVAAIEQVPGVKVVQSDE